MALSHDRKGHLSAMQSCDKGAMLVGSGDMVLMWRLVACSHSPFPGYVIMRPLFGHRSCGVKASPQCRCSFSIGC